MRTQHGGPHPSAQLVQGPADFWEALELVEAQFAYERGVLLRGAPGPTERARWDHAHSQVQAATGQARRVWLEEQEAARLRTIDRLRGDALAAEAALDDEAARWLGLLATALEDGDYSGLAIWGGEGAMSNEQREFYTTWGAVRGCCYHLHQTYEAAQACIERDHAGCVRSSGRDAYSDRGIRVVSGREELRDWDTTRGPGHPISSDGEWP